MARTIDEGFNTFLSWLTPTDTETQKAKTHRASIEACLKQKFGLVRFFRSGSFGNGTSISNYSDVDYFASIPRSNLKNDSSASLREFKVELDSRFPNTGVRIDAPAVVVPFGDSASETTEVVLADYISKDEYGNKTYDIANKSGGWQRSSPDLHKFYVEHYDDKLNKKVKPLVRFIKAWKYYQDVPISSFFLEMFVANYSSNEKTIVFDIDIKNIFESLKSNQLLGIDDPMEVSGKIVACKNETDRAAAIILLKDAIRRSQNAVSSEHTDHKTATAFYWWNKLYNDMFPNY